MRNLYLSFLTVLIILLSTVTGNAQFEKTYVADTYNQHDYSVLERIDRTGYLMAGTLYDPQTGAQDASDIHIISTDYDGNLVWQKRLHIDNGFVNETCFNINYANDENYILTGKAESDGVNYLHLIIIDGTGNIINQRVYNVGDAYHTNGLNVITCNHEYLVAGFINSISGGYTNTSEKYSLVLKVDNNLDVVWHQIFNSKNAASEDYDMADFIIYISSSDQYYVGGFMNVNPSQSITNQGALSVMLDNGGNILWNNSFTTLSTFNTGGADAVYDDGDYIHYLAYNCGNHGSIVCEIDVNTGLVNRSDVVYDGSITTLPNSIMFGETSDQLIISGFVPLASPSIKATCMIDFDLANYTANDLTWYNNPFANYSSFTSFFHFNGSPISYTPETMIKVDDNYLVIGYRDDLYNKISLVLNETDFAFNNDCDYDSYTLQNATPAIEYLEIETNDQEIYSWDVSIKETAIELEEHSCYHCDLSVDFASTYVNCYPDYCYSFTPTVTAEAGVSNITYYWDFGDGSSSTNQSPTHAFPCSGYTTIYQVTLTVSGICDGQTVSAQVTYSVGIPPCMIKSLKGSDDSETEIMLYPNPNNGLFTLELNNKDIISEIYITNIINQIVSRVENISESNHIDISDQPKGMYFINIKTSNETIIEKVIVK